jgi:hypothetical protein
MASRGQWVLRLAGLLTKDQGSFDRWHGELEAKVDDPPSNPLAEARALALLVRSGRRTRTTRPTLHLQLAVCNKLFKDPGMHGGFSLGSN